MQQHEVEILLIEDNLQEAELTIRSLKKQHLTNHLLHIDDSEEALNFIFSKGKYASNQFQFNPKLILLDLKLPKIGGLEILRQLKSDDRTRAIPVVVLTSSREQTDIETSYQFGVNSYIVKPVNFEFFHKAVAELGQYWAVLNQTKNK